MYRTIKILSLTLGLLTVAVAADAGWEEGVAAFKARNYGQAAEEFKAVVDAQPEYASGHFMLGQCYLKLNRSTDALTHARKAYELEPDKISHQFLLGQAYLQNQRYGESVQTLRKINPASLPKAQQDIYNRMLAAALDKSGQSDQAVEALRKVAQSNPSDAAAWFSYGTAALNADQLDQGISALERAIGLDRNDGRMKEIYIKALIQKARLTRDSSQKKAVYTRAVPVAKTLAASGSHDHLLLLGEVQLGAGQFQDALGSLVQATRKNGNDFYTHFYTAQAQTSLERWSEAEGSARRALELATRERDKNLVWTQIGFINEKMKRYNEAIAAYRTAGNQAGLRRAEENKRIAEENAEIERHNEDIERLQREQEELEKQLRELEGGEPPPRR